MDENFAKSRYDRPVFPFLFVFVGHAECCSLENFSGPWHTIDAALHICKKERKRGT
jgi:hypothetical protein